MSLYQNLQQARTEEDIKRFYVEALWLKWYSMNLIDIQTDEIWFEAKIGNKHSTYEMFTQLLHYVVHEGIKMGRPVPPFLAVIDSMKAAIMRTNDVLPLLEKKNIKWWPSASKNSQETIDEVSTLIGTHFVSFRIETHEENFVKAVRDAIEKGEIIRTEITPDNLRSVFDKWVDMIGREIQWVDEKDYALLFFADIMHDGTVSTHANLPAELLHKNNTPIFSLNGNLYELWDREGYRQFWQIYHKPPREEHRNHLLERRDSLIPLDERSFKWAYFTPLHVVDKAYEKLSDVLGDNWQKDYIVWDMCCGVGNLEVKHNYPRNLYMSTLDQADVDIMKASKTCVWAERFQYDYLNDDIADDGTIDYSLTNKVPESLRKAIKEGKKILVLINPPYGEAASSDNKSTGGGSEKTTIASNKMQKHMSEYGFAKRELFVQFLVRIQKEIPNATLAMFSTLKYINASNFEDFRKTWDSDYKGGFIVHSKAFDGLKWNFPIGFLIWQTSHGDGTLSQIWEISVEILDKNALPIGEKKFYNLPKSTYLGEWVKRPKANSVEAIPLKNAITPATNSKDLRGTKSADWAIGSMLCAGNDIQPASTLTALLSSGFSSAGAFFITPQNLLQAAIIFSVRRLIKPTWINDRDQFLQPTGELTEEFKNDCLVWMLFNGSNLTASANNLEWNGRVWSIVNHFIPFTESEVGSPERFESDFMIRYMQDKVFSTEAQAVLEAGKKLWQAYFLHTDNYVIRDELKLNRPDVGWYQIRHALKRRNENSDYPPVSFTEFEEAYKALSDKLRPMVYELGFLKT
jgi:hypothetical protein